MQKRIKEGQREEVSLSDKEVELHVILKVAATQHVQEGIFVLEN